MWIFDIYVWNYDFWIWNLSLKSEIATWNLKLKFWNLTWKFWNYNLKSEIATWYLNLKVVKSEIYSVKSKILLQFQKFLKSKKSDLELVCTPCSPLQKTELLIDFLYFISVSFDGNRNGFSIPRGRFQNLQYLLCQPFQSPKGTSSK